jgi:hypothetical protein
MQIKYTAFLLIGLSLFACKKKKDEAPDKTSLLVAQAWKLDAAGIDTNNDGTIDPVPGFSVPSCTADNTFVFNSNGTGVIDEGATKCNTSAPQTSPFNWNFLTGETTINLQSTALFGLGGQFKMRELSSAAFRMSKDTTISGFAVSIVINLKH